MVERVRPRTGEREQQYDVREDQWPAWVLAHGATPDHNSLPQQADAGWVLSIARICQNDPVQMNAAAHERSTPTESLSGLIERVTYFNEENGFCVLRLKAPGHRDEVTVIGSLPSVSAGEWLAAEGW